MPRRVSLAGLILVVTIWAGVLLTPQLRLLMDSQRRSPSEWVGQWVQDRLEYKDGSLAGILQEHPDDPRVLVAEFESQRDSNISYEDFAKAQLRHYDKLIAQFPSESWLIQNRLRLSTTGGLAIDTGKMQAQSKRNTRSWLSHQEISQALKIAERGVQLDPQNSFYDWMRAAFLFALEQPQDALRALADGARKPNFDDGVLHDMQIRVDVHEMRGPLLWEERMGILASMLLPHFARFRNVNHAAVWRGVLDERNGNHQQALEIYGNQMKLAATMGRNSTNLISMLVAESLMRDAWSGLTRRDQDKSPHVGKPAQSTREKIQRETGEFSRAFADYANKHGRNDLAQTALRLAREAEAMDLQNAALGYVFGAEKMSTMQRIGQSHWFGVVLMRITLVLVSAWILLSLISFAVRGARILLSPLDLLASTLFSASTVAVVFYIALRIGVGEPLFSQLFGGDDTNEESLRVLRPYLETTLIWLPLFLTLLYCGVATLWRARKNPQLPEPLPKMASIVEERNVREQVTSGLRWGAILAAVFVLCYLVVVLGFLLLNLPEIVVNNEVYLPQTLSLILAILVFCLWRRRKDAFRSWPHLLAWSRSTLGALVVMSSVVYLCTSLLVLPLRRQADVRLDDVVARGEVAILRDLAAKRER